MGGLRRAGDRRPLLPAASTQRERFRVSLEDAVDGVDIIELQTGQPRSTPAVRRRAASLEQFRASLQDAIDGVDVIELQTGRSRPAPEPVAVAAAPVLADDVVAPLISEIAALRAEVRRLQALPAEVSTARRRDLLTLTGVMVFALGVAVLVLTLLLRG